MDRKLADYSHQMRQVRQSSALGYNQIFRQVILNLRGESGSLCSLTGAALNEVEMHRKLSQVQDKTGLFAIPFLRSVLHYLFGEPTQALQHAERAEEHVAAVPGMFAVTRYVLFDSLIRLALVEKAPRATARALLRRVRANLKKLRKWAAHAEANHAHSYFLVSAEYFRVRGQADRASKSYQLAIQHARQHEWVADEALACELAGQFLLSRRKFELAQKHLRDAWYAYLRWGALAKVKQLEKRFAFLDQAVGSERRASAPPRERRVPGLG